MPRFFHAALKVNRSLPHKRELLKQVLAMLFSDLPLVTVSALTLGGIATNKSATDQQLEDEKKKTETERQKNGKSQFR